MSLKILLEQVFDLRLIQYFSCQYFTPVDCSLLKLGLYLLKLISQLIAFLKVSDNTNYDFIEQFFNYKQLVWVEKTKNIVLCTK